MDGAGSADPGTGEYDTLAGVYDWLVPDALLTPSGSVAAFADAIAGLPPGARMLDCACGTGQLAVGLALQGFEVAASDASEAMVERTRSLAREHGLELDAVACAWEDVDGRGWQHFDAIFCVGNSIAHAPGRAPRRAALAAMAGVLRPEGLLVVTSRNWELVRRGASRLEVADTLVVRDGTPGLVIYAWTIPEGWDEPHFYDVAVALVDDGDVTTHGERLRFHPFTRDELDDDLRAAGLTPLSGTRAADAERYLVTARRTA